MKPKPSPFHPPLAFLRRTKLLSLVFGLWSFIFYPLSSQVPQGFNYQAIVRDGVTRQPIVSQPVLMRVTIEDGIGTDLYQEIHSLSTDEFGIISIIIGQGTPQGAAVFDEIDWNNEPLSIKTELQYPVGGSYTEMGTAPLMSVPYAMVAEDTETKQTLSIDGSELTISDGNTITIPSTGSVWQTDGTNIYRETGNVGIKTTSPAAALDVNGEGIFRAALVPTWIEMNAYSTGDRFSGIDFHGDDTWTDFSLRIYRHNAGEDAYSRIWHRGLGSLQILTNEEAPIDLLTAGLHRLRVAPDGKIGIATTSPVYPLDVNGEITSRGINSYRLRQSTYSTILRNDNNGFFMLLTDSGDPDGGFNALRPFSINLGSGNVNIGYGALNVQHGGNIGVGTPSTSAKMVIQPSSSWSDEVPLFEVKNKNGIPVLAVYNNGVRIVIDDTYPVTKGPKGGFAIGGYDYTKAGSTVDFMRITPDSIRLNINNESSKGPKGGFAIGGYDRNKGNINEDFMYITPQVSAAGQFNTYLGYNAGKSNISGANNAFIGYLAGTNNESGTSNVFIGDNAGSTNIAGDANVYIGFNAGKNNTGGSDNIFIGYESGLHTGVASCYNNVFIGMNTGIKAATGYANVLVGDRAGYSVSGGDRNVILGAYAAYNPSNLGKNSNGSGNILIGEEVATSWTDGGNNVIIGKQSAQTLTTGNNNTIIGYMAGRQISGGGTGNVFLGNAAGYYETGSNTLFIDNQSRLNEADARVKALIYGVFNASVSNQLVVINGRLDVPSVIRTTGVAVPSSGAGLELSYSGGVAYVESYDRSASTTKPLCLSGSYVYPFNQINLGSSANRWNTIYCVNAVNVSDSRLKKEILDLHYGLASIMKLEPVTFMWNDQTDADKHIGLIAQDVAEVIKEVVDIGDDEEKTLGINYSQLVPVLIKGMQEQQAQIEQLNAVVAAMKEEIASLRPQ